METVEYKNIAFTVWDVGGQDKVISAARAVTNLMKSLMNPRFSRLSLQLFRPPSLDYCVVSSVACMNGKWCASPQISHHAHTIVTKIELYCMDMDMARGPVGSAASFLMLSS